MTDTTYLKKKIAESGLKGCFIYNSLGISKYCYYNRLKGATQFKSDEISKLTRLLGLTSKEAMQIFFPKM